MLVVAVWLMTAIGFAISPLVLHNRPVTLQGFVVLAFFIGAFVVGSLLAARPMPASPRRQDVVVDFSISDRILKASVIVSLLACAIDLSRRSLFDLGGAYQERSDRVDALIYGFESEASLAFQIAFLTYPAGIVLITRFIAFEQKVRIPQLLLFGLLPTLTISLALGGRSPLLYALAITVLSVLLRRRVIGEQALPQFKPHAIMLYAVASVAIIFAMNYFLSVFITRAEVAGGIYAAFDNAALNWGVSIDPQWYDICVTLFGEANTYLIFVFFWYLVQGLVMSNQIFQFWDSAPALGTYGVDLVAAVSRRINPEFASSRFLELLDLNLYGFLPSAFGSLYVDFGMFGILVSGVWGYLAGMVYRRAQLGQPRWLMLVPFVVFGILFSLINTPLGFSNGLMVHFWMIVAFLATRPRPVIATRVAA